MFQLYDAFGRLQTYNTAIPASTDDLTDWDNTGRSVGEVPTWDGTNWTPGPGGGVTIQRPPLTPVSPVDDFSAASLDGAWSAHNSQGSFATTDCITQARDGSNLRMMFAAQMGALYRTQANTDLDFKVGGIRPYGLKYAASNTVMFGIAALNSVGTGVGLVVYDDTAAYLANITTWNYSSALQTFADVGSNVNPGSEYWLRLVRTTNSWVGYVSLGGKSWGTASSSSSVTITVDRIVVGLLYNTATAYNGALEVDWIDVT